ncbi:MAG TPA: hypothetical protein PL143_00900 [Rhodocyclaceae bacterium]|nr:hypothetical protein [Rhodocyclaceae bacterium]
MASKAARVVAALEAPAVERQRDRAGGHHRSRVGMLDEAGNVFGARIDEDLLGRADLHDHAVLHDRDAVAQAHRLVQVVRDEQDGAPELVLDALELLLHRHLDQRVERRERLVHQQHARLGVASARARPTRWRMPPDSAAVSGALPRPSGVDSSLGRVGVGRLGRIEITCHPCV